MTGPDTPPEQPDPGDVDWPDVNHPHVITVMCQECGGLIEVRDIHAYLLSNHLAVCQEMSLLNGGARD